MNRHELQARIEHTSNRVAYLRRVVRESEVLPSYALMRMDDLLKEEVKLARLQHRLENPSEIRNVDVLYFVLIALVGGAVYYFTHWWWFSLPFGLFMGWLWAKFVR